jgi:sigma-B regulation protein RsbU (phosphoserine phosphatase)
MYTDGLSEAPDASGQQYGIERLAQLLSPHCDLAAKELVNTVLADLNRFRSGAPRTDDLTIMILRRSENSPSTAS